MPNNRPVKVQLFESAQIRTAWDKAEEKWCLSALGIIAALTDQPDDKKVRNYWKWLKNKLWLSPQSAKQLHLFDLRACAAEGIEAKRVGKEPNLRPVLRTVAPGYCRKNGCKVGLFSTRCSRRPSAAQAPSQR